MLRDQYGDQVASEAEPSARTRRLGSPWLLTRAAMSRLAEEPRKRGEESRSQE